MAIHSPNLAECLAPFAMTNRTARPGYHAYERVDPPLLEIRANGVEPGIAPHNISWQTNWPTRSRFLMAGSPQPTRPCISSHARLPSCTGEARRSTHEQGSTL